LKDFLNKRIRYLFYINNTVVQQSAVCRSIELCSVIGAVLI